MKHLPNLLTLANLFCGCIAIAYILSAQPFLSMNVQGGLPSWQWIYGAQQIYYGGIFIGIAAICDMLDGLTARALKIFSPIGKDLDSLADVVSFGVAPSVIIFKFLWDAQVGEKNALDVSMLGMAPAFLIACFAALRLAKYNITASEQKAYFIGMPVPAVGIFVGSLPMVMWFCRGPVHNIFATCLQSKWILYLLIALLCWLMVSRVKFIKMIPSNWSIARAWPQYVIVVFSAVAIPALSYAAIPMAFILYVLLSFIYRQPETVANNNAE
jgi:CDP-diacylglycerol---serine O-phosphatidyltransferase